MTAFAKALTASLAPAGGTVAGVPLRNITFGAGSWSAAMRSVRWLARLSDRTWVLPRRPAAKWAVDRGNPDTVL